mgnify:CR=1 FL=1
MDSFRRILAEVGRNEMLKCFQGISLIFKIMGKKIVNSFKDILSRVGENWIEAMKYYNYPR